MTAPDDGRFVFTVGNIYPRIGDWDRSWTLDGIDVLRIIEDYCFWMFHQLPDDGRWPALTGAKIDYRQGIRSEHTPLKISGWVVGKTADDVTLVYMLRPEAAPDADPSSRPNCVGNRGKSVSARRSPCRTRRPMDRIRSPENCRSPPNRHRS